MKTSLIPSVPGQFVSAFLFSCLLAGSAWAQTASPTTQVGPGATATTSGNPSKSIGPAPANTPQHHILNGALSPQTRQTLQEAMNSTPPPPAK